MAEWTKKRVAELKRLWGEEKTGGEIARIMGVTRGTIMGKAFRLGLISSANRQDRGNRVPSKPTLPKLKPKPVVPKPKPKTKPENRRVNRSRPQAQHFVRSDGEHHDTDDGMDPWVKGLMPKKGRCKWPYGDPKNPDEYATCGRRRDPLASYCEAHIKEAYQGRK